MTTTWNQEYALAYQLQLARQIQPQDVRVEFLTAMTENICLLGCNTFSPVVVDVSEVYVASIFIVEE